MMARATMCFSLVTVLALHGCTCGGVGTPIGVAAVSPAHGPDTGGDAVVIQGVGFEYGAQVRFGDVPATDVQWLDHRTLSARTPAGVGWAAVTVVNPDMRQATLADAYLYTAVPCAIAASDPGFNATSTSIVGPYRLTWTTAVDPDSLAGHIMLRELAGAAIPIDVSLEDDRTVVIHPQRSLHFWGSYGIEIAAGITTRIGDPCSASAVGFTTMVPTATLRPLHPASIRDLVVVDHYAIAASPGYRGLQVYDITDVARPVLAREVLTEFDPVGLAIAGARLYAPLGYDGVYIFDVSDPGNPALLWRAGTPGYASDVEPFVQDGRQLLAVADGTEGVRLLDVTDAEGPMDLGAIDPSGSRTADVRAVSVAGDLLAIGDGNHGLELASIADIDNPAILAAVSTGHPTLDVLLDGAVLYASHGYYGVESFDVANPAAPTAVTLEYGPNGQCAFTCVDYLSKLARVGDELFVAADRTGAVRFGLDGAGGVEFQAALPVPGHGRVTLPVGPYLLVGAEEGLLVFDRDAPDGAAPVWFDEGGHGLARGVALDGDVAYVAASTRGLQTFSVEEGTVAPALVDRDDSPGALSADIAAFTVETMPGRVILGDGRAGITLYDTTVPTNPIQGGSLPANDRINSLAVAGTTVFACDDNHGVMIVDVSDFANPVQVALLSFSDIGADQCLGLALQDDVLYVASGQRLLVADVSTPQQPTWVGVFPLPAGDSVGAVAISGDYLLATTSVEDYEGTFGVARRLQVFSLADPYLPQRVYVSEDLGAAGQIAVVGDIAFVTAQRHGVFVFDVSAPGAPIFEGAIPTAGDAVALRAGPAALYVTLGAGGLVAVPTGPLP